MGIARINVASWIAVILGMSFVFVNRFAVGPGESILYALAPTMVAALAYVWALAGHWECKRSGHPLSLSALGLVGVFLPAWVVMSDADGDIVLVALGIAMCISVRILTSAMIGGRLLTGDFDSLD